MGEPPTYKDLEQRVKELEKSVAELGRIDDESRIPEEWYKAIFRMVPASIVITDKEGRAVDINPFHVQHIGKGKMIKEDFIGKKLLEIPSVIDAGLCDAYTSVLEGESLDIPCAHFPTSSGGTEIYLRIRGEPIIRDGEVTGAIFVHEDLTQQKRANRERLEFEKKLSQSQKLESLGLLAGGIAHDFNNLLMGILGNAELALLDLSPVSPAIDSVKQIQRAAHRSAELAQQMLAYAGKGKFVRGPMCINEVVEEMAHLLEVVISKNVALRYDFGRDVPAIQADATQIRQVAMNLISNASEAIGDRDGVIRVTTGSMECDRDTLRDAWIHEELPEGTYVYFEVADTGSGIDKDEIANIFDPFFSTKLSGRGLGLSAVLGIVRGHNGTIKVYSEPGKGTTFRILFPAIDVPAQSLRGELTKEGAWQGEGVILLVDDEEEVRRVGRNMLERMGFEVISAVDGQEALDRFNEHGDEIVCVILDLVMPRMGGKETFRALRRAKGDVRIILSSGFSETDVSNQFAGKVISGFIQKPYDYKTLLRKMHTLLGEKAEQVPQESE